MSLQSLVSKPVLAVVINVAILVAGAIGYQRLSIRQIPNIDSPVVTIATTYPGANPRIVESQVTKPIEDAISGVDGVDFVQSISRADTSQVTVYFDLSKTPEAAAADVRDRVGIARGSLPAEVLEPVVRKQEADAQAIIYVALLSDRHSPLEITDVAHRVVKDRLQSIPGVAEAKILGSRYAMRVWLDPIRLAGAGLTSEDVESALRSQNVEIPAGTIESDDREFTVFAERRLQSAEDFARIVLRQDDGYLVRLGDVAKVELGGDRSRFNSRYNGKTAIPMGLVRLTDANPLEIAEDLRKALPGIARDLPAGMKAEIAYDTTIFISHSVANVTRSIAEAVVLVIGVILLFLRSWRAAIVPVVTIPVSLVGTFAFMLACGFSINTLTLLAMVLAIGLVVDDAIVVLENVHRQMDRGFSPIEAARRSVREVGRPVVAMTLTLAAVYLPLAMSGGRTGKLFTEFALTLAFTVVLSGVTALTLTPMMSARLARAVGSESPNRGQWFDRLSAMYRRLLDRVLAKRRWTLVAAGSIALCGLLFLKVLPAEIAPPEDQGMVVQVAASPEGATLEYTDRQARKLEEILSSVEEGNRVFELVGINGVTSAVGFVGLKDWAERERSAQEVAGDLMPRFRGVSGLSAFPVTPPPLGQGGTGQPISVALQSAGSWEQLGEAVSRVSARMKEHQGLVAVDTDLRLNKPELRLDIDNDKLASVGTSYGTVARALETMLGGRRVTRFSQGADQYDVIVQVDDGSRKSPAMLGDIHVRATDGKMMPLSNVVTASEVVSAKELNHFNKLRSATITAGLSGELSQGEALDWIEQMVHEEAPDMQLALTGQSREFRSASADVLMLALLALVFIYLVLAAQFESFVDPLIILLSVPMAVTGALGLLALLNVGASWGIWRSSGSWNIYTQIGVVTLVGLIAKHGILIVEFANQRVLAGDSRSTAIRDAALNRLRPILMTTSAMVLGAIPLAMASGAGAEARQQIGWVVVGGMVIGTILTLFVVPAAYSLLGTRTRSPFRDADGVPSHASANSLNDHVPLEASK